jgi:transcriptional regulator with XRE-family HTH domain
MDDRRVGRIFREVRVRRAWRQSDLAESAGVSQSVISLIERGRLEDVSLARIRKVGAVLDISVSLEAWWRSGNFDRLIDRGHAALVEHVVGILRSAGWTTRVEVTFNDYGDRGSADIVAWHPTERILLIVEVKTMIGDVQATASSFERKVRVLPKVLQAEEGWDPVSVARLLVMADTHANRDVVRAHSELFGSIWPARTSVMRRWISSPAAHTQPRTDGAQVRRGFGGIWFLATDQEAGTPATVRRTVRVRHARAGGEP